MTILLSKFIVTFIVACLLWLGPISSTAQLQRLHHPMKKDGSLNFLVVGDWGRKGLYNQSLVSYQMGVIGEKLDIDFVISTGDNFYDNGLLGVDDPAFQDSFTNIYTAPSLQKPWYSVLGNHDYRGNVEAQLNPILRKRDSRWVCLRSFVLNSELVEFFFVDTTPFVNDYFEDPGNHTYDWRGVHPRQEYLSKLLQDVNAALEESTAKWKIVVGHHTIFSAGQHFITKELLMHLLPVLKANNVDMYINGHDHCLQHITSKDSPIHFITSGGGSKAWRGVMNRWNPEELKLYYDGQGFMSLQMTQTTADFVFYDFFGNILHKWSITKELNKADSID